MHCLLHEPCKTDFRHHTTPLHATPHHRAYIHWINKKEIICVLCQVFFSFFFGFFLFEKFFSRFFALKIVTFIWLKVFGNFALHAVGQLHVHLLIPLYKSMRIFISTEPTGVHACLILFEVRNNCDCE